MMTLLIIGFITSFTIGSLMILTNILVISILPIILFIDGVMLSMILNLFIFVGILGGTNMEANLNSIDTINHPQKMLCDKAKFCEEYKWDCVDGKQEDGNCGYVKINHTN